MITVTEPARQALAEILERRKDPRILGLRLHIKGGLPGAYESDFLLVREGDPAPDDIVLGKGTFNIYISPDSWEKLDGAKIDMAPTFQGASFKIEYPQPKWDDPLAQKVQQVITSQVNPGLASHGGYAALLRVEQGYAHIVMGGGCQGCGLSQATLRQGIETMLKQAIPELKGIIDRTDHASGANPYYQAGAAGKSAL